MSDCSTRESRARRCYWVVLPAYNEELSLPRLLERISAAMVEAGALYRVIVVDDGSSDGTAAIAQEYAQRIPLFLERHSVNMGLGATIRDGILRAIELSNEDDMIITMDADNSHNPELIPRMGQLLREGNDVVIASRYQRGSNVRGVPFVRRVLGHGASWLFRLIFPIREVRDYTCGYRAYRAAVLKQAVRHYRRDMFDQSGFQCTVDILLKLRPLNLIFKEIPMILRYDMKGSKSKMKVAETLQSTFFLILKRRLGN